MDFKGKTALVTGAAVGVGRATAITFAEHGANVIIVDMDEALLERTKKDVEALGVKVLSYVCDVSDEESVNKVTKDALEKFGKIEILVNNAGIFREHGEFMDIPISTWEKYIGVNVMGVVYFTKALLPQMIENSYGKIVNVGSVAGVYGNARMVHYSATKGAIISMTKALAKEVAEKGININCVSPGSVTNSRQYDDIDFVEHEGFAFGATYSKKSGSQRDNANLICFLASDEASYIMGQNIQIDGCRKTI